MRLYRQISRETANWSISVDLQWRMHEVSDGERRRVQIVQGLMAPWEVLLLDEVRRRLDGEQR